MATFTINGVASNLELVRNDWSVRDAPADNVIAVATKAAVAGMRHVATTITACLASTGISSIVVKLHLRDGASGSGTILWSGILGVTGINQCQQISVTGLSITGSTNTDMTLEFSSTATTISQSVTLTGFDIT